MAGVCGAVLQAAAAHGAAGRRGAAHLRAAGVRLPGAGVHGLHQLVSPQRRGPKIEGADKFELQIAQCIQYSRSRLPTVEYRQQRLR